MAKGTLLLCAFILSALGLAMILDASLGESLARGSQDKIYAAFFKQALFLVLGIVMASWVYKKGYESMLQISPFLFWGICVLLVLTLIPGIGQSVNGARRWIRFLGFSFQPSEMVKFILPLRCIQFLKEKGQGLTFQEFYKHAFLFSIPLLLIFLQPDNGTVVVIGLIVIGVLFLTRVPLRYWLLPIIIAVGMGGVATSKMPHVRTRFLIYLNPEQDLQGKGHQPYQAKIAVGSGQLQGKGIGKSLQKLQYLPEAQNDYIAAIFAEEFGFIGVMLLLSTYLLLTISGLVIAKNSADRLGFQVASVLTFTFAIQVFLNLAVVSGLMPSTGMNLPLFSQGGTALVVQLISLGIIVSVTRKQHAAHYLSSNLIEI